MINNFNAKEVMPVNKSESKYFKTAIKMDEAFLELICKKELAFITVKEICEKAGVNRSTFYLHYENVGDLLTESVSYMHKSFMAEFDDVASISERLLHCEREELLLVTPAYLRPYLEFIRTNRRLYKAALEKPEIFMTDETYGKMFEAVFDPVLERFSVPLEEREYRMAFYLSGIEAIVAKWLKRDCEDSVERIIEIIYKCVMVKEIIAEN